MLKPAVCPVEMRFREELGIGIRAEAGQNS
jgi:hypothetical protein